MSNRRDPYAWTAQCPQPAEADISSKWADSRFDPSATLAVHCGNGFDAGFSPYQSTRLSRYNAVPLELGCGYAAT
jgi:hypothetical protein